jgi:two-component system NtrC family sensor kinase
VLAGVEKSAIVGEWLSYMTSHLVFGLPATAFLFDGFWLALRRTKRLYDASAQDSVRHGLIVLQKPYDLESLRRNIREAIERAKARRRQVASAK